MSDEIKTTIVHPGQHRKKYDATYKPVVVQEHAVLDSLSSQQEWYRAFRDGAVLEWGSLVKKVWWFCENHALIIEAGAKVLTANVAGDVICRDGSIIKKLVVHDNNFDESVDVWPTRVDGIVEAITVLPRGRLTIGKHARIERLLAEPDSVITVEEGAGVEHFIHPIRFNWTRVDHLPKYLFGL